MKVLIVKTSSLGDLIHTLPALTDAEEAVPGIRFDWVAEEVFAEIPSWHRAVDRVIPVAVRRWRKNPFEAGSRKAMAAAVRDLRAESYDAVIDVQGLIKSAVLTRLARGRRFGMDRASCREPLASLAYGQRFPVPKGVHAIDRVRMLFAKVLGYGYRAERLDYGLDRSGFPPPSEKRPYLVFLHGTSRPAKLWPQPNWIQLAHRASKAGYKVLLPWGSEAERRRADEIAAAADGAEVLAAMSLRELAGVLAYAKGAAGVDTGLAHLTAAFGVPGVTLYFATFPALTGARGHRQICLGEGAGGQKEATAVADLKVEFHERLCVERIWTALMGQMDRAEL